MKVNESPTVDGITGNIHRGACQAKYPNSRNFKYGKLQLTGFQRVAFAVHYILNVIIFPIGHRGQAHRMGTVFHEPVNGKGGENAQDARTPESGLPAKKTYKSARADKGQPFADGMAGAPDAVVTAALAVAEPLGQDYRASGSAKPLKPAIEGPQGHPYPKQGCVAHCQIYQRAEQHSNGKKTLYIGMVGQEAVGELSKRIGV